MNILITGGAGFIGSHLCERLIKDEHSVVCMDDLSTGAYQNIKKLVHNPRFTFINHDILTPIKIDAHIDQIYNLACPASPVHYQKDPIRTLRINVEGSLNVLNFAKQSRARVLQASTSEVYGDPDLHPQPEAYTGSVDITGIRACYDEGKRSAETLFFDYNRMKGVDIRVVRIFNTYGPRMRTDDGRVVPTFLRQALHNENITLYGDGSQTRSFQFVDDLVNGLLLAMNTTYPVQPVNLGNPQEFTIQELAAKVLAMIPNTTSRIEYRDLPANDPKRRRPDISRAKALLNWQPSITLDNGLSRTIKYYLNNT